VSIGEETRQAIIYGVEERPPLGRSVIYGFQHIFAMILGSITGAVVIGTTVGLTPEQIGLLVGYINVAVGIATILQVQFGVRLPIVQGSTSGHLPAYLALGSVGVAMFADPMLTMQYLGGALLVGALLEAAFGMSNGLRHIFRWVSPMTIGIVIMMVGLGLFPVVVNFIDGAWGYALGVIALVLIGSFALGRTAKTMALFGAVVVAYAIAMAGTAAGLFGDGHALFVDFATIAEASWVQTPELFPWGWPKFNIGFILAMSIPYVATMFESLGDYLAVAESSEVEQPNTRRLSRGITAEGIASAISASIGGTATSSFSQNVGVVRLTGVASRFVCLVAGALLIALGMFGKLGTVLGVIPEVILGSVYLVAFGILVMTGLRLVLKVDVRTSRNETIIGSALLLGLAVPSYFRGAPLETDSATLDVLANVMLATPMIVGGVWAFVLDNLIPGSDEERGLTDWVAQG
jgi:solute carrier family 23 (nucleobase transporter), member 1